MFVTRVALNLVSLYLPNFPPTSPRGGYFLKVETLFLICNISP